MDYIWLQLEVLYFVAFHPWLRMTFITWDADTEGFNKKQDMGIKDEEKTLKMPWDNKIEFIV